MSCTGFPAATCGGVGAIEVKTRRRNLATLLILF